MSWEGLWSGGVGSVIISPGFLLALCLWEIIDFISLFLNGQMFLAFIFAPFI